MPANFFSLYRHYSERSIVKKKSEKSTKFVPVIGSSDKIHNSKSANQAASRQTAAPRTR